MINRFRTAARLYPRQFWLLFTGLMISTIGSSMIWPFLTIYLTRRLELPSFHSSPARSWTKPGVNGSWLSAWLETVSSIS